MKNKIETALSALALAVMLACSGGSSSGENTPPPVNTTHPIPPGTYRARSLAPKAGVMAAPIGDLTPTLIVQNDGNARLELPGWEHLRTAIYADLQGALQISPDASITHADGTTIRLTLSGTLVNGHMVGTSNAGDFDLELTAAVDVPQDLATKAGVYLSTSSSNGQVMRLTVTAPPPTSNACHMLIEAYPTQEDLAAGTNRICRYQGSLGYSDADTAHVRNCFNAGFQTILTNPDGTSNYLAGGTSGLAYFTETGDLVVLTANANNANLGSGQLSAYFARQ